MNILRGKRTYLIMLVIGVLGALRSLGYVDDGLYATLLSILAPAGVMALRASINSPPSP